MRPGEYRLQKEPITINEGRETATVRVINRGDRPVQVGSHYHFFEVNPELAFERELAYGMHLDIASGTSVRFEPGEEKDVQLAAYGGNRYVQGFHGWVNGPLDDEAVRERAFAQMRAATGREQA